MKKRIMALILAVFLAAGMLPVTGRAAQTVPEETEGLTLGTGLLPVEGEELDIQGEPSCGVVESTGARAVSEWDKYANHYYYNQMNEREQAFYDSLDDAAYSYLTSGVISWEQGGITRK